MPSKKVVLLITSLVIVCFLLFKFLPVFNPSKQVSVNHLTSDNKKQTEILSRVTITEVDEQSEEENQTETPITVEIKNKVREVVEGAIDLFTKDQRIVAIGDSLTQGVGDATKSGGYVGILNHTFEDYQLNMKIENFGKRGNRSDQLLKRLEKKEIEASIKKADIVLITIGANDIMRVVKNHFTNLTLEPFEQERVEYEDRLRAIFTKINELNPDTQIYLIGFYNPFEYYFSDIEQLGIIMNTWNDAGAAVTEEFDNVSFIPTNDLFTDSNLELLADDLFHPNTKGYKLIAQRVLEYLKEHGDESELTNEVIE